MYPSSGIGRGSKSRGWAVPDFGTKFSFMVAGTYAACRTSAIRRENT